MSDQLLRMETRVPRCWRYGSLAVLGAMALVLSVCVWQPERSALAGMKDDGPDASPRLPLAKLRSTTSQATLVKSGGGTEATQKAVAAAVEWIARHQSPDGSWSLTGYTRQCADDTCSGRAPTNDFKAAATAMGLLPLQAAGHKHTAPGPHQQKVQKGLDWLIKNQKPDGDLSGGTGAQMYSHALAALALCDAYAMTADPAIAVAAQRGIDFIEAAQDPQCGGWRYTPRSGGDTSVFGWQFAALSVGKMGGLKVRPETLDGARRWLASVAQGERRGKFCYVSAGAPSPSMTAVGLLASQHLGMKRDDPAISEGTGYLAGSMADQVPRNIYCLYYAAQAMHNLPGKEWESWNKAMCDTLLAKQVKDKTCAAGSWNPSGDMWGPAGGRLMITSFACLTLEVYYRYPRLYQQGRSAVAP